MNKEFKTILQCVAAVCLLAFAVGCKPPASETSVDTDLSIDTGVPEAAAGGSNVTASSETPDSNTTAGSETPAGGETPE